MKNKFTKKRQRKVNKAVKLMNQNLQNDPIWKGRFQVTQIKRYWEKFPDNSGGIFSVLLKIKDEKTNIEELFWLNYSFFFQYDLWRKVNDFACKFYH